MKNILDKEKNDNKIENSRDFSQFTKEELIEMPIPQKIRLILQKEGLEDDEIDGRCLVRCCDDSCDHYNPAFYNCCEGLGKAKLANEKCSFYHPFEID